MNGNQVSTGHISGRDRPIHLVLVAGESLDVLICPLVLPVRFDEPEGVQLAKMSLKYLLAQYLGNREDYTINFGGW